MCGGRNVCTRARARCDIARCDIARCDIAQCDIVRCDIVRCDIVHADVWECGRAVSELSACCRYSRCASCGHLAALLL